MKKLIIDTTDRDRAIIALEIDGNKHLITSRRKSNSQKVLPMIVKILKKHNLGLKDLTEVEVNTGPGSFTGIRVGISIANALGQVLNIGINSKKAGEKVSAKYK
jgi:tRNA threonylcarbamoyladenosine biosynthesis protein TsaB